MPLHLIIIFVEWTFVILFLVVTVLLCFFFVSTLYTYLKTKGGPSAPFIPLSQDALKKLVSILATQDDHVLYELGCGDARVICTLSQANSKTHYRGIERNLFVYYLACVRTRFFLLRNKRSVVKVIHGDIFEENLGEATHLVTYLFPEVMNALLPKLQKELKKGSLLYSVDFMFKDKTEREIIPVYSKKLAPEKKIYVYEF